MSPLGYATCLHNLFQLIFGESNILERKITHIFLANIRHIRKLLLSFSLCSHTTSSATGFKLWMDHSWVSCDLSLRDHDHNKSRRFFNNFLLKDEKHIEFIEQTLKFYFSENNTGDVSPQIVWDVSKPVLWSHLIALPSALKKEQKEKRQHQWIPYKLQKNYIIAPVVKKVFKSLLQEHRKLELLDTESLKGKLLYLKRKKWTVSPQALKMLTHQVKAKTTSRYISQIKDPIGKLHTGSKVSLTNFMWSYTLLLAPWLT